MDRPELAAFYRAMAEKCSTQAETISDVKDARLHRAFADQFEQYAKAVEDPTPPHHHSRASR